MYGNLYDRHFQPYRHQQCGLCKGFGAEYGQRARLLAGADPSLLLMLAEAVSEEPAPRVESRCPLPPFRMKRHLDPMWAPLQAVLTFQLLLLDEKLLDDQRDGARWSARLAGWTLRSELREGRRRLAEMGFDVELFHRALAVQAEVEARASTGFDAHAAPTGRAFAQIGAFLGSLVGVEAPLAEFAEQLGRCLVLVDALVNLADDLRARRYNPFAEVLGDFTPASVAYGRRLTLGWLAELRRRFELLPLRRHQSALERAVPQHLETRAEQALKRLPASSAVLRLAGVL